MLCILIFTKFDYIVAEKLFIPLWKVLNIKGRQVVREESLVLMVNLTPRSLEHYTCIIFLCYLHGQQLMDQEGVAGQSTPWGCHFGHSRHF